MKDRDKNKKQLVEELEERKEPIQRLTERDSSSEDKNYSFYQSFYECSPVMFFTLDKNGDVLAVNPVGAAHLGYSEEELVEESVLQIIYKDDRHGVSTQLKNCFENPDKTHSWELRKVKKDGSIIWVNEKAKAIKDKQGGTAVTIVCQDITEQKQAESLVNIEKKVLEMIARNAPLPGILTVLCREIEGQTDGMLCSFLLPDENGATLRHEAAPSLPEGYARAIDGVKIGPRVGSCGTAAFLKEPVIVTDISTDPLWADYKDTALRYGLKACWSAPIISTDDKILGTFAMYYDHPRSPTPREKTLIDTAIHLAQIAIENVHAHELASRFGKIMEESLHEIYIVDPGTFRFLQANRGARTNLGYTMEELRNMTPFDINPELPPGVHKLLEPLVAGELEKIVLTGTHRRKDGSTYPVEIHGHISGYEERYVFTGNVIDITDRKRAEEELKDKIDQLSKKNKYQSIIRAVTESVHKSLDLNEVFDNAVDALNTNVEGAANVVIFMVEGDEAVLKADRGHSDTYLKRVNKIPYPKGATWKTIIEGKARYVPDTDKDEVLGEAGKAFGTQSYLSMPIRSEEKTIGCIHIHSPEKNAFSEQDLDMLQIVARQLESAIRNAEQTQALRQSEQKHEALINTIEGIVWEADPKTLRCTFISKQAERILGYPIEDWTNEKQIWSEKLHPEDRERVFDYSLNESAKKKDHQVEYRMIAADGRTVWMRDNISVVVENDEVTGLRGLMVDITDIKNADDLLKESAGRYRTLVESIYDLVAESTSDGSFVYLSPNYTTTLGYDPEELLGKNIFEYVHPDDLPIVIEEFGRVIATKSSGKAIFRYRHRNGNWRWFESTGQTVETAAGDLNCVIVSRDITERRKMEEELFKSQKLESLGVLAGGIAHDFNNLLTVILGNISVSKMNLGPRDKAYGLLAEAEKASFRAKDLTSQLLTFSRGGAPVKEYVQSVGELITDTANFAISGSKVKCEYDIEDNLWPAEVDGGQISQVIHNLVINADQAMPDGGTVTVAVKNELVDQFNEMHIREGRYIKITIGDTGIGMTEELKDRIFDPYFTTKQRGSGLGLATVYSIVKNHEGHIEVKSQIGTGTTFSIYLPAAKNMEKESAGDLDLIEGKGKILIMDDEKAVMEIAGEMLTQLGYTVDFASDGAEAIEKYTKAGKSGEPFDAVVLDLTIPGGMGGLEAQKNLLELDPDVKAIVSSGYSNDPVMAKYGEYGFSGVVAKPYNIEELSKALHKIMGRG